LTKFRSTTSHRKSQLRARKTNAVKRIYYFAGGSWQSPPMGDHFKFLGSITQRLKQPTVITLISYPLAPKSPAPATFSKLSSLCSTLSKHPAFCEEDVCFAGDSSGANITLALTMYCLGRDTLPPSPAPQAPGSLRLISPTVDLLHEHPEIKEADKHDPIESLELVRRTRSAWAGEWDKRDPRLSPVYGTVKILAEHNVKAYGIIAGYDVLSPEAKIFVKNCQDAQVEGRFLIWDKQMHIFPLMAHYKIPEARKAVDWIIEALEEGRRDAGAKANEGEKDEQMLAAIQSRSGRDADTLENEASNPRSARNMQATQTSPKTHKEFKSDMNLCHSGLATR
jgi:acetyl esterase/lipase